MTTPTPTPVPAESRAYRVTEEALNSVLKNFGTNPIPAHLSFMPDLAKDLRDARDEVSRLRDELREAQRKPISIGTALKILQAYFDGGPECAPYDELAALEKAINEWESHGSSN